MIFFAFSVVGLFLIFRAASGPEWRLALAASITAAGLLVFIATELLSGLGALHERSVSSFWAVTSLVLAASGLETTRRAIRRGAVSRPSAPPADQAESFSRVDLASIAWLALLLVTVLVVNALGRPNNWDSMTYHLSRVEHWRQNGSVEFFATDTNRELYMAPMAEYVLLQFRLLSGSDHFYGIVQWFFMVSSAITASLLARLLGADKRGQLLAAVLVAALPIGILESATTQNDVVAAGWALVCLAALFVIDLHWDRETWRLPSALLAGGSLGLGTLTKLTVPIFVAPFVLWLGVRWLRTRGRAAIVLLAVIAIAALSVNLLHWSRNERLFGSLLGPEYAEARGYKLTNDGVMPAIVASNVVRNLALQLTSPFPDFDRGVEKVVRRGLSAAGIDPDDARNTWRGTTFHIEGWKNENSAGNPLHLVLLAGCSLAALRAGRSLLMRYAICLMAGWVLFSAAGMWQPWNSRLVLPFFALGAPLCAAVLSGRNRSRTVSALMLSFSAAAMPFALAGDNRPIIGAGSVLGRERGLVDFTPNPRIRAPYLRVAELLKQAHCSTIGLKLRGEVWEYPLWLLVESGSRHPEIRHVEVEGASSRLELSFRPCALLRAPSVEGEVISFGGEEFTRVFHEPVIDLYLSRSASISDFAASDRR